jgi:hypothetical protein
MEIRDLFYADSPGSYEVATYDYCDNSGKLLYQVVRYAPKDFRVRRPAPRGGWIWSLNGARRVLYHLPEVVAATTVVLCEGEKDCETAQKLGLVATCNQGGAGKWCDDYTKSLTGKHVSIIADADEPGRKHARNVAAALHGKAVSVKVVELLPAKDLTEWVDQGGTIDQLQKILDSAPEWPIDKLSSDDPGGDYRAESPSKRESQAQLLVELADEAQLFHTGKKIAYATIRAKGHREHWRVQSREFQLWLRERFYLIRRRGPNAQALKDALSTVEARAIYEAPERPVAVRLASHEGKIYLDLADSEWRAVEIGGSGWRVVKDPPVAFIRTPGMDPLPAPEEGGEIQELRPFINADGDLWALVLGWLVAALNPRGPYPVLVVGGEQGSAKSSTAKVLRMLVDPNLANLRSEPKEARDLMIAANNSWVILLDNLSRVEAWLSDALCRLSTGGGFAARKLYTDDEEAMFNAQRPVILNGIEEIVHRGDLLDRSLILDLPAIPDERRVPEEKFWADFEVARPRVLGALLSAVASGLQHRGSVKLSALPRMADFAVWATACEPALGLQSGSFMDAYRENITAANEVVLEASPVVAPLWDIGPFEGTAQELLEKLRQAVGDSTTRLHIWPKTPRGLSGLLRRLAPNLRRAGVSVDFRRSNGERLIVLASVRIRSYGANGSDHSDGRDGSDGSDGSDDGDGSPPGSAELRFESAEPVSNHHRPTDPTGPTVPTDLDTGTEMSPLGDFQRSAVNSTETGASNAEGERLVDHIGEKVKTPLGEGTLRQVFRTLCRVSLLRPPGEMRDFPTGKVSLLNG